MVDHQAVNSVLPVVKVVTFDDRVSHVDVAVGDTKLSTLVAVIAVLLSVLAIRNNANG